MKREERSTGAFAISIALHVVIGAFLLWVLSIPMPLRQWLTGEQPTGPRGESVRYSVLGGRGGAAVHAGGNGRPQRGAPTRTRELTAPVGVPQAVPVPKPGAPKVQEEGTGPIVSAGGAGPGIMPMMRDPRVWLPPGMVVVAPLSDSARFDSTFHETLAHFQDTLAKMSGAKALAGVFTAGGKKYGVDSQNIYIADYKIPAALLAVLPIHGTGWTTPEQAYLSRQTAEINYQAGRALDAEDFRTAVRRIRQRHERERHAKDLAEGKSAKDAAPVEAPDPPRKVKSPDPVVLQTP